ncbi:nucleotide exchange factor GrpE [Lutispora thermophila]|uniref:Protein GrpE n=1 Tax=Lutispora thermophila DSM 19022 TaxID=1122184 RepID=A0A1M6DCS9_9FIRM|nr:nucleotide exchange factor GrpE [Lutispora thermophila]SHI70841.1 molecular chaperone GrpE [Lutispora thermophila DSM 19022]
MKKKQETELKSNDNNEIKGQEEEMEESSCEHNNEETSSEMEKMKEELKAKEEKIKEYEAFIEEQKDRHLRLQADFDNYRKRVAREREEIFVAALEDIMTQLLPTIDNFDRALDSFRSADLDSKYIEGLEMIYKEFVSTLQKNGLEEIEALNCEFDPNKHHAVMQVEANEEDDNKVKEVFQKGYTLKSKVIRPAMVKVAVKN